MSPLKMSSLVLLLSSAVLIVVSLATDHWVSDIGGYFGLWKICFFSIGCGTVGSGADIDATRAFVIISFLLLLAAVGLQINEIWIHGLSTSVNKQKLTAIVALCAGASAIIAMSVFTGFANRPGITVAYSWSYGLGWASAALSVVAGIVGFVSFKQDVQS